MSFNVVGFVNIRLDERQARDPRIAAHHVQHRHAAAARADLKQMGQ